MPGGPDQVSLHTECWDYPEPIVPPVIAGRQEEGPADENTQAPEEPKAAGGSRKMLRERWQATHRMDPPAWAGKGFTGIKEHMKQQAVTKLFILSPKLLVCSLSTAHTCTVTTYTHHFDFGTGREYIMSSSGSHEARRRRRRYNLHSGREDRSDV